MYKKLPQNQVTYHTPKKVEKQLDYILTDKKHYSWSRDAEANDTIHMGSDHRCVMAKFEIPKERGKRRHLKETLATMNSNINTKTLSRKSKMRNQRKAKSLRQKRRLEQKRKQRCRRQKRRKLKHAQHQQHQRQRQMDSPSRKMTRQHRQGLLHQKCKKQGKDEKILALIQERKSTAKNEKEKIKEISKEIKRCIRDNKRSKRREKCEKILEEVKGTRNISSVTSVKKRILITKVKNKEGEAVKTRQGIANVFEKFNEDLYEGEEGYTEEGMDSRTEDDNRSQSTQLHSRVYKK